MGERRKYIRFNVLLDAICRAKDTLRIKVSNFAREGAGLISKKSFKEGDDVEIEMMIPGDNVPVLFEGEITWTNSPIADGVNYRSGIKFKKINSSDRSKVLEYIYRKWITPATADASK